MVPGALVLRDPVQFPWLSLAVSAAALGAGVRARKENDERQGLSRLIPAGRTARRLVE